ACGTGPLKTVKELLDVLERVAESCPQHAAAFVRFRLTGAGVLQGRCDDGKWQTILAYCGGWRRLPNGQKVRCAQSPLFLGQDETCYACGKLVCHRCGYCNDRCSDRSARQANWPASWDTEW